jgi:hypothetical protein
VTSRSRFLAALATAVATVGLPVAGLVVTAAPAAADTACDEALFMSAVNDVRASRGLPRLTLDSRLSGLARTWSGAMATTGVLGHNPALTTQAPSVWRTLAENVGVGPSAAAVQGALEASARHLANMVNPRVNAIGVGVAWSGATLWATQVFMEAPAGSLVAPPSPPCAEPTSPPIMAGSAWYRLATADGATFAFGAAPGLPRVPTVAPIVAIAAPPAGAGTWTAAANGAVYAHDGAPHFGSADARPLNQPVVGMAATPSGRGYWLVARDGGIFAFGDARFFGSTGAIRLNQPIVGMAATPSGQGYRFVAADGGVFSFGDAPFLGSAAGRTGAQVTALIAG